MTIITVHSAKGLEYPVVFIPGLEDGLFPHQNSIEEDTIQEERRLFYVALTRARRELHLSYCRSRTFRGKPAPKTPSRFLAELPEEVLERVDSPTRAEETKEWLAEMLADLGRRGKGGEG